jgi:hypothetical protein
MTPNEILFFVINLYFIIRLQHMNSEFYTRINVQHAQIKMHLQKICAE